jgi:hypothetical protein
VSRVFLVFFNFFLQGYATSSPCPLGQVPKEFGTFQRAAMYAAGAELFFSAEIKSQSIAILAAKKKLA